MKRNLMKKKRTKLPKQAHEAFTIVAEFWSNRIQIDDQAHRAKLRRACYEVLCEEYEVLMKESRDRIPSFFKTVFEGGQDITTMLNPLEKMLFEEIKTSKDPITKPEDKRTYELFFEGKYSLEISTSWTPNPTLQKALERAGLAGNRVPAKVSVYVTRNKVTVQNGYAAPHEELHRPEHPMADKLRGYAQRLEIDLETEFKRRLPPSFDAHRPEEELEDLRRKVGTTGADVADIISYVKGDTEKIELPLTSRQQVQKLFNDDFCERVRGIADQVVLDAVNAALYARNADEFVRKKNEIRNAIYFR